MKWFSYLWPQVVEQQKSKYNGLITVYLRGGQYVLSADNLTQSGGILDLLWRHVAQQLPKPKNVLILGLGGGSVVKAFYKAWPRAAMVGIDIDPVMIRLGKKYLNLTKIPTLKIVEADAFSLLPQVKQKFDVIVVDLYHGRRVPEQTISRSFLTIVKDHLAIEGVVVFNLAVFPDSKKLNTNLVKCLKNVFTSVQFLKTPFNQVLACYYRS